MCRPNGIRASNVAPIVDDSEDADYMLFLVDDVEDVDVLLKSAWAF